MLNRSRSSSSNNSTPSSTLNWRSSRHYGSNELTPYEPNYGFLPSGSQSSRANLDSRGPVNESRSFGRRAPSFGSASFPTHHGSPVQIIIVDPQLPRESNPRPRQSFPSARAVEDWHYPSLQAREERYSRSSSNGMDSEQQNKALESLRKEFYNPSRKRITNRINLYYRDTPVDPRDVAKGEDGKRCAVCLEDFERGQEVMVTPCKHMFHEDCIVPWAKSNAHCPVCRFVFGPEAAQGSSSAPLFTNNYYSDRAASTAGPGLTTQEFLSILGALGDGFQL